MPLSGVSPDTDDIDDTDHIDHIDTASGRRPDRPCWTATWVSGPDAGGTTSLDAGEHLVGRSPLAAVRCDDPTLEPFHLRLRLPTAAPVGTRDVADVGWCQLAGRRPVVAETWPTAGTAGTAGTTGSVRAIDLHVGAGVLRIERGSARPDTDPGSRAAIAAVVVRRPRVRPAPVVDVPASRSPHRDESSVGVVDHSATGGLGAAVTSLAVGVVLAVVMHQTLLLVMGAVGAVVALGGRLVTLVRARRRRRRHERERQARAVADAADRARRRVGLEHARREAHPGLPDALDLVHLEPQRSWYRRPEHGDAFEVVVAIGAIELVDDLADDLAGGSVPDHPAASRGPGCLLDRVPITERLDPGARVAVGGPWGDALVRSIVVQLAATTGPADWQLVVVSERPERWSWLDGLPHLRVADAGVAHDDAALSALLAEHGAPDTSSRHLLLLTDDVDRLAVRTSGLRRLLHVRPDAALLVSLGADPHAAPALCERVWAVLADGRLRASHTGLAAGLADGMAGRAHVCGLGASAARRAALALVGRRDPEAPDDRERGLPTVVSLEQLWHDRGAPVDRTTIAQRWRSLAIDDGGAAPIGTATDGTVDLDLVRDGPHGLIAGTTGSGKSELLRTLVLSSALALPPDRLSFVLVDFKGGATFDDLSRLPHVAGVVTDLEPRLAGRVLRGLRAEVTRREQVLRQLGCPDLSTARERTGEALVPRLVILVDEFAALALEHAPLLHALIDVARRGRSLGVHLILATQRPAGVVSDEIRANTDLRIALRLHDTAEAVDVVGDPSPATLRRTNAGRAVLRLGPGDLVTFQCARPVDAAIVVEEVVAAARSSGLARAPRPWCDALPELLTGVGPRVLGRFDRPDEQRQDDWVWEPVDGHLLVVGAAGSGVTTTLAGVVARHVGIDDEVVVLDAVGDRRWSSLATHPRVAAVARLHERELVDRVLERATSAIGQSDGTGRRFVVVDGLTPLRRELEAASRVDAFARLDALLTAPPPGVTLLIGNDALGGLGPGVLARCGRRLVLHLHDPAEVGLLGRRAAEVPAAVPGRALDAATGDEVQLAPWPVELLDEASWRGVPEVARVRVLPEVVPARTLPRSAADGHGWQVVVGVRHDDLCPAVLDVPEGEHVLVIGPARSGRTEVLDGFRRCWSDARPDAAQVVVAGRRVPRGRISDVVADALDQTEHALAEGRRVLLAIDDVEQVPDPEGRLAGWAVCPPAGLVIVAAARPDTVRAGHAHWAAALRRHRRGVVLSACDELEAELLGARLPRHAPLPPRPGLCWLVGDGETRLAQAAS